MGETIKLNAADGHALDAYLAQPAGEPRGRLVVVQEIFGVNGHIRDVCDRFAADGYVALAPALFDRVAPGTEFEYDGDGVAAGRALKDRATWPQVAADIAAARDHLAAAGLSAAEAVAIIGYCWGGSVAWLGAAEGGFIAAIGYYGGQIIDLNDRTPKCPTLLHFGDQDGAIPLDDVAAIRAAHPDVTVHVYEGAGHGFNCDRRGSYHEAAAGRALERTNAFLTAQFAG